MQDTATAEISRFQGWQWLDNDILLAESAEVLAREPAERILRRADR